MTLKGFTLYKKNYRSSGPWVGIRKNGQIVFNSGAVAKYDLDRYTNVLFYISNDRKQIAIKFINDPHEEGAHGVQARPGAYQISAITFLNKYDIFWEVNRTFKFTWVKEENVVVFRLEDGNPSDIVPANRI